MKEPSHLLGTMHVKDIRVFQHPDSVWLALANAERVVLESDPDDWTRYFFESMGHAALKDQFFELYVGEEDAGEQLDYFSINRSFGPDGKFIKWVVKIFSKEYEQKEVVLDSWIWNYAQENGIPFSALELMSDYEGYDTLDIDYPELDFFFNPDPEEMISRYASHDLDVVIELFEIPGSDSLFLIDDTIMVLRNIVMANGIDTLVHLGRTFVGIGAAHLPGKFGVINLLRDKGYTVRPIRRKYELPSPPPLNFDSLTWETFLPEDSAFSVSAPTVMEALQKEGVPPVNGYYGTIDHNKDVMYFVTRKPTLLNLASQKVLPYFEELADDRGMQLTKFNKEKGETGGVVVQVEMTNWANQHKLEYHFKNNEVITLGVVAPRSRQAEADSKRFFASFEQFAVSPRNEPKQWETVSLDNFGMSIEIPEGATDKFLDTEELGRSQLAFALTSNDPGTSMYYELTINDMENMAFDSAGLAKAMTWTLGIKYEADFNVDTAFQKGRTLIREMGMKGTLLRRQKRIIAKDDRLIQLTVIGNEKSFDSLAAQRFIQSFSWKPTPHSTVDYTTQDWHPESKDSSLVIQALLPGKQVRVREYNPSLYMASAGLDGDLFFSGTRPFNVEVETWLEDHFEKYTMAKSVDSLRGIVYATHAYKLSDYFSTDSTMTSMCRDMFQGVEAQVDTMLNLSQFDNGNLIGWTAMYGDTSNGQYARVATIGRGQYLAAFVAKGRFEMLTRPSMDSLFNSLSISGPEGPAFDLAASKSLELFRALESPDEETQANAIEYMWEYPFDASDKANLFKIIDTCSLLEVEESAKLRCSAFDRWSKLTDSTDLPVLETYLPLLDSFRCYRSDVATALLRIGTPQSKELYLELLPKYRGYLQLSLDRYVDTTSQIDWLYPALTDEIFSRKMGGPMLNIHSAARARDSLDFEFPEDIEQRLLAGIDSVLEFDEDRAARFSGSNYYWRSRYGAILNYLVTMTENGSDTTGLMKRILDLPSDALRFQVVSKMMENKVEIPPETVKNTFANPYYRNRLYELMDSTDVETYLNDVSMSQLDFAISDLYESMGGDINLKKLKLLEVVEFDSDTLSGQMYVFTYKAYGRKWILFSGPQPLEETEFTLFGDYTSKLRRFLKDKEPLKDKLGDHIRWKRKDD